MELTKVAKAWIEMWQLDIDDPKREEYEWVEDFEYDAVYEKPDVAIDLVLEILKIDTNVETQEVLAAGPLEQVLANLGASVINRVEAIAKSDPQFANLLGGVWQNAIPNEIWQRIQKVWNRSGWDGNA